MAGMTAMFLFFIAAASAFAASPDDIATTVRNAYDKLAETSTSLFNPDQFREEQGPGDPFFNKIKKDREKFFKKRKEDQREFFDKMRRRNWDQETLQDQLNRFQHGQKEKIDKFMEKQQAKIDKHTAQQT